MLHKLIPDNKLPDALKKPLVFGNREQIDALTEIEQRLIEDATHIEKQEFHVSLEWFAEDTITVWAKSKTEAEEIASEDADIRLSDVDFTCYARLVT